EPGETPPDVLDKAFRAALSVLGRDATSAPSQVFLGGTGLGALSAARLAATRFPVDGLFFLGYPLHAVDQPLRPEADLLYRLIPSMLFVQGTDDPRCELDTLRRCLSRVGTPAALRILQDADGSLLRPEAREDPDLAQAGYAAIARAVEAWLVDLLDEP
ncbi:MAG: alpha/beta family hydrolase, partial [Myxococcota bacterium]